MASLHHLAFMLTLAATVVPATHQTFAQNPQTQNATPQNQLPTAPAQPAPGAMPGSDAVPSTLSEKNAADDKLIVLAYTFKDLSADARATIFDSIARGATRQSVNTDLATELPLWVELRPVPDGTVSQVPQTKGYDYVVTDNKVLLVMAPNRVVVGIFEQPAGAAVGAGSH